MSIFRHNLNILAVLGSVFMLLILSACYFMSETPSGVNVLVVSPVKTQKPCQECEQETAAAARAIEQNKVNDQAVATAEIVRANAQATLYSANATLNALQTQQQNNTDVIAAQIAATVEIVHANAKATLVAAGSTQSAALTQDAIQQTQAQYDLRATEDMATQNAIAMATQQQLEEQRQGPITFLWMWCFPIFIVLLAGLALWGFWRWLKIKQANQYNVEDYADQSQTPMIEVVHRQQGSLLAFLVSGAVDRRNQLTKPKDDQVRRWFDEVKRKLQNSDKDENDNPDN